MPHTVPSSGLTATEYRLIAMRLSFFGSTASPGSTYATASAARTAPQHVAGELSGEVMPVELYGTLAGGGQGR